MAAFKHSSAVGKCASWIGQLVWPVVVVVVPFGLRRRLSCSIGREKSRSEIRKPSSEIRDPPTFNIRHSTLDIGKPTKRKEAQCKI